MMSIMPVLKETTLPWILLVLGVVSFAVATVFTWRESKQGKEVVPLGRSLAISGSSIAMFIFLLLVAVHYAFNIGGKLKVREVLLARIGAPVEDPNQLIGYQITGKYGHLSDKPGGVEYSLEVEDDYTKEIFFGIKTVEKFFGEYSLGKSFFAKPPTSKPQEAVLGKN